jgi:bifunctional non-homologous end joining protein LigD
MITPMVPRLITIPFDRDGWLFEIKWDGFRAIAERDETGVKLYSRNHRNFTKRFPPITQAVAALKHNVILDGEIVALDDRGHARFEWLVKRGRQHGILMYFVFDLLYRDTHDLQNEPLAQRNNTSSNSSRDTNDSSTSSTSQPTARPSSKPQSNSAWKASSPKTPTAPTSKDPATHGTGKKSKTKNTNDKEK